MAKLRKRAVYSLVTVFSLVISNPTALHAEFELNFTPNGDAGSNGGGRGGWGGSGDGAGGWSNVECNGSSTGGGGTGWGGNRGGSSFFSLGRGCGSGYFLQEVGNGYFHVIVGDPSDDFALEWYIRSSGEYSTALTTGYLDNIENPLGSNVKQTGNGAGNPKTVHIREIVRGDGMEQEFLKAKNEYKPKITQDINDGSISTHFVADMSMLTYSDQKTPGTIINTSTINDPDIPEASAHFDMSQDAPGVDISAGMYTHSGGEFKNYTYAKDGFDVYDVKWIDFCDPSQNPDHKCKIGGSSGGGGWSSGGGGWGGGGGGW